MVFRLAALILAMVMGSIIAAQAVNVHPVEQTLSIIKPDSVSKSHVGEIITRFERNGLKIVALKMGRLTKEEAEKFYEVHRGQPFYESLVEFMSSGPIIVMVLEGPNAIARNREIMGATNPEKAAKGTLRADFGASIGNNAVHGSDGPETAKTEIAFFFDEMSNDFKR